MPSTFAGLIIFTAFVTPGFLNYLQRAKRAPQRELTSLSELATFLSVSIATNLIAVGIFAVIRMIFPSHTPDVELLISQGSNYIDPRIGYISLWTLILFAFSCLVAVLIGVHPGPIGNFVAPIIVDTSAWYEIFESVPEKKCVYVGCDLDDGSYIGGYLYWYNVDVSDVADRDLILAKPLTLKINGEESSNDFTHMIISARNISRIYVDYVDIPK